MKVHLPAASGLRALFAIAVVTGAVTLVCAGSASAQVTFETFGYLPGGTGPNRMAVSGDGSVILLGNEGGHSFMWSAGGGVQDLGMVPNGIFAEANAISDDGSTIVGRCVVSVLIGGQPNYEAHAFRWTIAGMQDLGLAAGYSVGAESVSADGSVVVGIGDSPCPFPASQHGHGWQWGSASGWQEVPSCAENWSSVTATDVSGDGTVIVGSGLPPGPGGPRAFRWTAGGLVTSLGTLGGPASNQGAEAVSADGSTIVGLYDGRAFRWTAATGMQDLGTVAGQSYGAADLDVSGDGSIVIGSVIDPNHPDQNAFLWTESMGMVDLNTLLPQLGAGLGPWAGHLRRATAISADGTTIIGTNWFGGLWIAHAPDANWVSPWSDLGFSLPGAGGAPVLAGAGALIAGSAGSITLSNAAPSALSLLAIALSSTPSPFKCGTLVPVPLLTSFALATGPSGAIPLGWASWPAGLSGLSLYFQYAIQDAGAICGAALSNALRADVP